MAHRDTPGTTVVPYEDGPLLIRGDFALVQPDGTVIDPGRRTVALCRCGKSASKPFCDGTHRAIRFRAGTGRDTPSPRAGLDQPDHPTNENPTSENPANDNPTGPDAPAGRRP